MNYLLTFGYTDAASLTTTNIDNINSEIAVCSGDRLAIVCSHNNTVNGVTRWEITDTEQCLVSHDPPPVSGTAPCGDFSITNITSVSGYTLNSTAEVVADSSLDGVLVECRAGSLSTSVLVGNVTIRVLSESNYDSYSNIQKYVHKY